MNTSAATSPLLRMTRENGTEFWNDSCAVDDLAYAIERGATGATSNPVIVASLLRADRPRWEDRIRGLASTHPTWSEIDVAWAIIGEMVAIGAGELLPIFESSAGRKGRQCVQVDPVRYRDAEAMVEQALQLDSLAPNIEVKFPATAAGIAAIEEATTLGVVACATVSFTLPQALAAAEAIERGLERREAAGSDVTAMAPMVVLMIGRLDDWLTALIERDGLAVDPAAPHWSGIAVFKRAYQLFTDRGYRSRLLAAATRHPLHWTELVGGDAAMTLTHSWQVRFDHSGLVPEHRIDRPVDAAILEELMRIEDFRRAYEPDGLRPEDFDTYGATARTLRSFTAGYYDLLGVVRDVILPDPDRA